MSYQQQQQVQRSRVEELEEECRGTLRESLQIAADTNQVSQEAAVALDQQTDQIRRIQRDADKIESNLDTSQELINGMKSWWASLKQAFVSPPEGKPAPLPRERQGSEGGPPSSDVGPLLHGSRMRGPEDSLDGDLEQLSGMLSEMHTRALNINSTIDEHTFMLEGVHDSIGTSTSRIQDQQRQVDRLLEK